jgi:hypothetical protein
LVEVYSIAAPPRQPDQKMVVTKYPGGMESIVAVKNRITRRFAYACPGVVSAWHAEWRMVKNLKHFEKAWFPVS